MSYPRRIVFGAWAVLAILASQPVNAALYGPAFNGAGNYDYPSDGATNVLVAYTPYAFTEAGTVDFLQSYNQDDLGGRSFDALQLRPTGVNSFEVISRESFATAPLTGIVQYALSTDWQIQAGDIYAHYGYGIPIDIPAVSNPAVPLYYPSSHSPALGEEIFLGSSDYPVFDQSRDYYLAVNFAPAVVAVPEPATFAIWGGFGIAGLVAAWRRKRALASKAQAA